MDVVSFAHYRNWNHISKRIIHDGLILQPNITKCYVQIGGVVCVFVCVCECGWFKLIHIHCTHGFNYPSVLGFNKKKFALISCTYAMYINRKEK